MNLKKNTLSWKDYFYWKTNKDLYTQELEKLVYYETTLKENIPLTNIKNENPLFLQIIYDVKQNILLNLQAKKEEIEQIPCKIFSKRKGILLKKYDTKILSLRFTLDDLKISIEEKTEKRTTRLMKVLETKILESSRLAAQEREAHYAASQTTIIENVKLKEKNFELTQEINSLINNITKSKGQNTRLAIALNNNQELVLEKTILLVKIQELEYQLKDLSQIKADKDNLKLKAKGLLKEVERLTTIILQLMKEINSLGHDKVTLNDELNQVNLHIRNIKESHKHEIQHFNENIKKQDLEKKAMMKEMEILQSTVNQIRKEKVVLEIVCANLTDKKSEPLVKLVNDLEKTVAIFKTVNKEFMPTLQKINDNTNEMIFIRDKIITTQEQRRSIQNSNDESTASKSSTPDQLDSLRDEAIIHTQIEERSTKVLLNLTESTQTLQSKLTEDVKSLTFNFEKINNSYAELLKRMNPENTAENVVKTIAKTKNLVPARMEALRKLKVFHIYQHKPGILQAHEIYTQEVTLRNLTDQLSSQIEHATFSIKNSTNNEEVD